MAYRWFLGLDLEERVPDHSTISQNRCRRFCGENIFGRLFEHILRQCIEKGLVDGKIILTDATYNPNPPSPAGSTCRDRFGFKRFSLMIKSTAAIPGIRRTSLLSLFD